MGIYFRKKILEFFKETFRKRNLRKWKKAFRKWKANFTWEKILDKILLWFYKLGEEEVIFVDPKDIVKAREIPKAPSDYAGTYTQVP